ncbi:hypothetical protein GCM10023331_24420 [Algivirga pacifica]|uniref:Uncharacterized protein n=1 Tax=Algivirga pacifica TaxID=1162670 RepID=A0ABP9DFA7_9BACT
MDKIPILKFIKNLGSGPFDEGKKIIQTGDGGYLVAGRTVSTSGNADISLWKLNADGSEVWHRKFGEEETEEVADILENEDGSFMVLGSSDSFDNGTTKDVWLFKVDAQGKLLWSKNYGKTTGIEEGKALAKAHDEGYLLVGSTIDLEAEEAQSDILVLKVTGQGEMVWEKTFGGAKSDVGADIIPLEDGYCILGDTDSYGKGKWDALVYRIDAQGEKIWERTYGGGDTDRGNALELAHDGGVLLAGFSYTFAEASLDCWVVKFSAEGQQEWIANFGGLSTDEAFSVIQTKDGHYVLAGYTEDWKPDEYGDNVSLEGHNVFIVKFDVSGKELWRRSLGGEGEQRAFDIVESKDSGFVVVGSNKTEGSNNYEVLVMKTGENGM